MKPPSKKPARTKRKNPSGSSVKARAAYALTHWGNASTKSSKTQIPDPHGAQLVEVGRLVEVVYLTAKGEKKKYEWEHETKSRPRLCFDANDPHAFFIERSKMKMTVRGIVG